MAFEHGSAAAEVACARCGDRSPAPGPFCGMCGARRTEPASPLPPSTNQLRCPHCGVLRTSTGRLCGSCGADTKTGSGPPSAAPFATPPSATRPPRSTDLCPHCGALRPATGRFCDSCEYVPAAVRRSPASAGSTDIASSPGLVPTATSTGPPGARYVVHLRVPSVSSQPEKENVTKPRPLSQRMHCSHCGAPRTSSALLCEACAETVTAPPNTPRPATRAQQQIRSNPQGPRVPLTPDYSSYTPPLRPPQNGPAPYSGSAVPSLRQKMKLTDLPWPVRIILGIVAGLLVWHLTDGMRTNAPTRTPCVMLYNTQTGQQLNPDCKPAP